MTESNISMGVNSNGSNIMTYYIVKKFFSKLKVKIKMLH